MLSYKSFVDLLFILLLSTIVMLTQSVQLGAVDTAVMGHLSAPYYIGAVALGAMIFNFIFHGFNCLRMEPHGPSSRKAFMRHIVLPYRSWATTFSFPPLRTTSQLRARFIDDR